MGKHPGMIASDRWIKAQQLLKRNQSGAYRQPRRNEALLTGVLYCSCGSRMYPKLTQRKDETGKQIYTYLCKTKERSRRSCCGQKNAPGRKTDDAVLASLAQLEEDFDWLKASLQAGEKEVLSATVSQEKQLARLRETYLKQQEKITALVDSLAQAHSGDARQQIVGRIEQLDRHNQQLAEKIEKMQADAVPQALTPQQIKAACREWSCFADCIARMTLCQKRNLVAALVQKVIWNGQCVHLVLSGAQKEKSKPPQKHSEP